MTVQATPTASVDPGIEQSFAERRVQPRLPQRLCARLVPLCGADAIDCVTDDLGPGGMHVTVPGGYGVAVGQDFELKMAAPGASLGMGPLVSASGLRATVVRTKLRTNGKGGCVGVGLRFSQPLCIPVS